MNSILLVFILCLSLLLWTYLLYPVGVHLAARFLRNPHSKGPYYGKVSLIVAAHNEEAFIKEKILNSIALEFGAADWEVIVVSDGSVDMTEKILNDLKDCHERLKIIKYQPRAGKANALNEGVHQSRGDVLIFTDANVFLNRDAACKLLAPFADPLVGAVCGKVLLRDREQNEIVGEGLYMKFENMTYKAEAALWSMVGVDGALFALRRELFTFLHPETILDDFSLSMNAPLNGKRIVYEEDAVAVEDIAASVTNEFKRKSRIVAGGFQYIQRLKGRIFNLGPFVFLALISHKLMRWLSPIFLIGVFISSVLLIPYLPFFKWIIFLQIGFYLLAYTAYSIASLRNSFLFYIPYYFSAINIAALNGLARFILRKQKISWEKVSR